MCCAETSFALVKVLPSHLHIDSTPWRSGHVEGSGLAAAWSTGHTWLSMCPCPEPQVRGKIQTHPEPHPLSSLCSACQSRYFLNKEGDFNNLTAAAYHKKTHLLVTGFASGIFHLHELPEFNLIHSLR